MKCDNYPSITIPIFRQADADDIVLITKNKQEHIYSFRQLKKTTKEFGSQVNEDRTKNRSFCISDSFKIKIINEIDGCEKVYTIL